jgi:hypothetical protein
MAVPESTMELSTLNDVTSTGTALLERDADTNSIIATSTSNAVSLSSDAVPHCDALEGDAEGIASDTQSVVAGQI